LENNYNEYYDPDFEEELKCEECEKPADYKFSGVFLCFDCNKKYYQKSEVKNG
tara:strand:- start:5901 stop:6059 length:159 start_codon:yes stop_codon:yes gene_type:complete